MTPVRRTTAALSLGLIFTAGCAHKEAAGPTDNILHIAMLASPTTFDPAMVQDGTTIDMLQNMFEGLVQWTPQNKVEPALADSWTVSKDGRTYTFHIRPGVKFQDGDPVTAEDVYYSVRRALDPSLNSPVAITYLGDIVGSDLVNSGKAKVLSGVKVINSSTVAITIKKPKAYWIYTLTYPTAYVVSHKEADTAKGPMTDAQDALGAGTGPFRLDHYDKDSKVVLTSNAAYWAGAPKIAGQERPIVIDAGTRHSLYLSGKLDVVDEQTAALDADLNDPTLKSQVKFYPRASTFYIGLNQKAFPAFKNLLVRQAFAYATDKSKIRQVVFKGRVDVAQDILPEGIPGFDPSFKGIPYDPAKAKALLAQAGYPGGKGFPTVPVYYRESYPQLDQTVDLLRVMWRDNLGVTLDPRRTEWATLLSREDANTLECYHIRWAADYLDQQDYYSVLLRTGSSEDHTSYSNPQYDALCDAADISQDPVKRSAMYRKAARIAADEVPLIPLYYQQDSELVKPYVTHLEDGLMGHLPYVHLELTHSSSSGQ